MIKKTYKTEFELARKFYSVLFILNDAPLTNKEMDLLAFTAVRGSISTLPAKTDFGKEFGMSNSSINNIISKLQRMGILKKIEGKTKVNPQIQVDLTKKLNFEISRQTDTENS